MTILSASKIHQLCLKFFIRKTIQEFYRMEDPDSFDRLDPDNERSLWNDKQFVW